MTRFIHMAILALLAATLGCSRHGARTVSRGDHPDRDYQAMLSKVREKNQPARDLVLLKDCIDRYQVDIGRLPSNLVELVELGYIEDIPPPPEGSTYVYNSEIGQLRVVSKEDDLSDTQ